jgi:hypothetical protein
MYTVFGGGKSGTGVKYSGAGCATGGFTVTLNEQLAPPPQPSLAKHDTLVVPTGKVLPLGGLHTTVGEGLHPPLAVVV